MLEYEMPNTAAAAVVWKCFSQRSEVTVREGSTAHQFGVAVSRRYHGDIYNGGIGERQLERRNHHDE